MMHTQIIILAGLLALATSTHAATCYNNGAEREVNVEYTNPGQATPCKVRYTKLAASHDAASQPLSEPRFTTLTLWRAEHEAGYCEARATEFLTKLETLGWRCDKLSTSAASPTEEPTSLDEVINPPPGLEVPDQSGE